MKTISYSFNRKKNPSRGLSGVDYAKVHNLDFYYETKTYTDKERDALYDEDIRDLFRLRCRGDIWKFPKGYFSTSDRHSKCKAILRYLYNDLYKFSDYEIRMMSHRQFLVDASMSYLLTSGLFPKITDYILEALNAKRSTYNKFTISDLKGHKKIDITKKARAKNLKILEDRKRGSNTYITKKANFVTGHNITGAVKDVKVIQKKKLQGIKPIEITVSTKVKLMLEKNKLEDTLGLIKRNKRFGKPYSEESLNKLTQRLIEVNKTLNAVLASPNNSKNTVKKEFVHCADYFKKMDLMREKNKLKSKLTRLTEGSKNFIKTCRRLKVINDLLMTKYKDC